MIISSHDSKSDELDKPNELFIPKELASLYTTTFPLVGKPFLDSLLKQLTVQTNVKCAVLMQLLQAEEYKELSNIYKNENKQFHVVSSSTSSSPDLIEDASPEQMEDRYLLIRASYSTLGDTECM